MRSLSWMTLSAILCASMIPSISHSAVGRMAGTAGATTTGAATYSIPINAPAGTNGLTPRLAFAYRHSTGASPLGVGWSIAGLSSITRCASTFAQDGVARAVQLSAEDRFCLDGQRLRLTSGTYGQPGSQYATEIETFSRITASGTQGFGPASFTVERQDGLIYDYGATNDSRIEALGAASVRTWAVNKIRDRAGNAITFSYAEDATYGSYQVSSIQYAGNANLGVAAAYQIAFVYETLPVGEVSSRYIAGALVKRVVRLKQVNVMHGADLVRRYDLGYEPNLSNTARSRLLSIQECADSESDCLLPTTFGYQNGIRGFIARAPIATVGSTSNILVLDVNGDGRSDVVYSSSASSGTGTWMYAAASGAGGFAAPVSSGITNYNFEGAIAIDYNADGLEDVLVPYSGNTWWVMLGTASGLASPVDTGIAAEMEAMGNTRAMDVTGDGLDDLVWYHSDTQGGQALHYRPRIYGGTFGPTENLTGQAGYGVEMEMPIFQAQFNSRQRDPDFNGDGRADLILRYSQWDPEAMPAPNFWTTVVLMGTGGFNIPNIPTHIIYYPDLNGDGYSDIAYVAENNWYYHLSQGTFFGPRITGPSIAGYDVQHAVVIDSEGDGYDDLWVRKPADNHGYLMRSTGEALLAPSNTLHYDAGTSHFVADTNGDGQTDILQLEGATLYYQLHNGVAPDLLVSVADGLDNQISFSYSALTSANGCYSRDSANPSFPSRAYRGAMNVVCSMTSSDGIGGTYSISYLYSNADLHLQGRGFLGFGKRRITDSRRNQVAVVEEYSTDAINYERLGAPLISSVRQVPSNQLVSEASNSYARHIYNPGFNERRLPYVAQTVVKEYEAGGSNNGALLRTATISNSVDAATGATFDSITTTVEASGANGVQAGASYTQRVRQPVANLTAASSTWCLGRPGRIETIHSHNQYAGDSVTRIEEVQWDTTKCRPTQIVSEPGHATLQVTRTLDYDDFGNIDSDTVTGIGMPARSTAIYWGTTGQFPTAVTNSLSQVTNLGWNARLGLQSSETDPNGLTVSWLYDGFGRQTRENRSDGTATTRSYANCSGCGSAKIVVTETDLGTNGAVITDRQLRLDSYDRRLMTSARSLSGSASRIEYQYDALGRLTRESAPCWSAPCASYGTSYSYDLRDRVYAITYPLSDSDPTPQTVNIYYEGLTTRQVDALGKQSVKVRNVLGGLARSTDHDGYYQHFDYDSFANVVRVTDSLGKTLTTNTFNSRGMTTAQTDLVAGTRTYTVNALGETLTQTDTKNQLVQFEYDLLGRLKKRYEPEGNSEWTWGTSAAAKNIGRLAAVSGPGYSESYTYDAVGRVLSKTINSDGTHQIDYTYNTLGTLHSLTYPASTLGYRLQVQYEYQNGFMYRIRDANAPATIFWTANDTDARGAVISETLGNGIQTIRGFDAATGQLDYIQSSSGGTSIQDLNYGWNAVGNLTQRQDARQGLTEQFYYDNLHRLSSTTGPDPVGFTYDARGNILTSSGGSASNGPGHTVTWTSYNLPDTIASPGSTASSQFFYAPDRSRYKQVANYGGTLETSVYIGGILDKVTVGSTQIWRHYIVGGSGPIAIYTRRSTGTNDIHYLTRDHLGSIDSVTSGSGAVEVRTAFGAFGQRRREAGWNGSVPAADWTGIASTTRRGFTDHEMLDNLRLTHMNGRVYDPQVGQFLSPDPFVQKPDFTQSFNRYSYTFNSPLSFTDPTGFLCGSVYAIDDKGGLRLVDQICTYEDDPFPNPVEVPGGGPGGVDAPGGGAQGQGSADEQAATESEAKCWNASIGIGGAAFAPLIPSILGPSVGVSGGPSVGFSYGGSLLNSRIFFQTQIAIMVGAGAYVGYGLTAQGGRGVIPAGPSTPRTLHFEGNIGMGVSGSASYDTSLDSNEGNDSFGGYSHSLPGGRLGTGMGLAGGVGINQTVTLGLWTFGEMLQKLGFLDAVPAALPCAQ